MRFASILRRMNHSSSSSSSSRSYLLWYSNEHSCFQIPELESLFDIFKIDKKPFDEKKVYGPFVILNFNSEDEVRKIMSRSVLARHCYEIWSTGVNLETVHENFKKNLHFTEPYKNDKFRIKVDTYGHTVRHTDKVEIIKTFDYLEDKLKGTTSLSNPDLSLHLIQYWGLDSVNKPPIPYFNFFGRWIADAQRSLIQDLSIKTRKFIGNTTMDPTLSLLMSNLALVQEGDLVLDPFIGTGGCIISAALHGAQVIGGDINYMMIHARTRPSRVDQNKRAADESVRANFEQYGIQNNFLDCLVCDSSLPVWKEDLLFDSILTDPPYGFREPIEKIGSEKSEVVIKEEHKESHLPCKVKYSIDQIYKDLIDFGCKKLTLGRRLVFWMPINRVMYDPENLPKNPCLRLVYNCEQPLQAFTARRLLVYEKIQEPNENSVTEFDGSTEMYCIRLVDNQENKREKYKVTNPEFFKKLKNGGKKGQKTIASSDEILNEFRHKI